MRHIILVQSRNSMEDSPSSEADSLSASQDTSISRFLWQPNFHCLVHNSPSSASILSQINPIQTIQPYLLKIQFNIILPSAPRSFKNYFLSGFSIKSCTNFSSLPLMPWALFIFSYRVQAYVSLTNIDHLQGLMPLSWLVTEEKG